MCVRVRVRVRVRGPCLTRNRLPCPGPPCPCWACPSAWEPVWRCARPPAPPVWAAPRAVKGAWSTGAAPGRPEPRLEPSAKAPSCRVRPLRPLLPFLPCWCSLTSAAGPPSAHVGEPGFPVPPGLRGGGPQSLGGEHGTPRGLCKCPWRGPAGGWGRLCTKDVPTLPLSHPPLPHQPLPRPSPQTTQRRVQASVGWGGPVLT